MMRVQRISVLTGNANTMDLDVTIHHLFRLELGEMVQDVCPHLSPAEREFLINGVTPAEAGVLLPSEEGGES